MKINAYILLSLITIATSQTSYAQSATIFAAASLTQPINNIIENYQRTTGLKISAVYAASSTLARQINQGAPADIYISANKKWMNYLIANKKIKTQSLTTILSNRLALIAPISSKIDSVDLSHPSQLQSLLKDSKLATGNVDHVPVGLYAKQALSHLALWTNLQGKLAFSANTRGALAFAERAAVPAAIVYLTDAIASDKVKTLAIFPATSHEKIAYPLALIDQRPPSAAAIKFYHYLKSEQAKTIFENYGFDTSQTTDP